MRVESKEFQWLKKGEESGVRERSRNEIRHDLRVPTGVERLGKVSADKRLLDDGRLQSRMSPSVSGERISETQKGGEPSSVAEAPVCVISQYYGGIGTVGYCHRVSQSNLASNISLL
ncbi:hypothetical protein FA13DRAFT_1726296 [Coprinellus micaceus]|uniref:Uncharacterized protein n=1 Tax=Coprinellus micaceus TaxID=71717 RepID=A0A4Y7TTE9_COPMI|nr:hypothetical protein FA13DRAFT_1726296 [Coprinellus micaceus]